MKKGTKARKEKKTEDLRAELAERREALRQFRFGVSGSRTKDVKAGRELRKEIARIETELSSRANEQ